MTSQTIRIRKAKSSDVPVLSQLIRDSFRDVAERFNLTSENCPKHPSNCTDGWIEEDFSRGVTYYMLECNGTAVGCVALEKARPDLYYLERLAVLPRSRRNGFGLRLVKHVVAEAGGLEAKQISIGIISEDAELRNWYQKIGFVEEGTKEFEHLPFLVTFMTFQL
jgi:N-acetylglutamate synthase-like GNAT family acetyltransferase